MATTLESAQPIRSDATTWAGHLQNIRSVMGNFSPWVLGLPAAVCAWIATQSANPWWEYTLKPYQETYAPIILAIATGCAAALWLTFRGFYYRWLLLLSGCLLCREIHFVGTSTGIYFAIPLLMWYASSRFESMKPFADNRLLASLLVGAFVTYFFAITVDRAVWKFLPNHAFWRNNIEETSETVGHLLILAMIICSPIVARLRRTR